MAAAIGVAVVIAMFRRLSRVLALSGVAGFGLCSFTVLYLTFQDPALWTLLDENTQSVNIMSFSLHYFPGNFGIEPDFQADLSAETLMDRFMASLYFIDWGWELCLFGSLLILLDGFVRDRWKTVRWTVLPLILILGAQAILLFNGLVAEYLRMKGDRDITLGQYMRAIKQYERAQLWNLQLARSERAHLRLGEAYYHLGMPSHPNARFYRGDRYAQQLNFKAALAEYLLVVQEASPPLREVIEKRLAWTYVSMGMALFRKGEVGPAIGDWERALDHDPAQVQAVYFLSRAYFDQSCYEQSLAMSRLLLSKSGDQLLNADVQATIGDNYWKLNDFDNARQAYQASKRLDSHGNFRIFKSLGGT
jgi:tetratricopeptide (TPR) repeat protein